MPEFILDHGSTEGAKAFAALDSFTQGYIEALFFTASDGDGDSPDWSVDMLAPETLESIIADCEAFSNKRGFEIAAAIEEAENSEAGFDRPAWRTAGMDFLYTRNGHGCGFWDGDWPEPYASELTDAAKAFGESNLYEGNDGRLYLS